MAKPDRPRVGEILLRAGIIDKHQLQSALGDQRRWGNRLGSALIKMGFIEEHALVRALASQLDMPVATLEGKRIHPEVLALVPGSVAEKYMVIPLFVKKEGGANCLFVGMEDPGSLDVLDELSFSSGMPVRPVLVGPSELAEAIDRYYCRDTQGRATHPEPDDTSPIVETGPDLAQAETPPAAPTSASGPAATAIDSGTEELARFWAMPEEDELDDTTLPEAAGLDVGVEPELAEQPLAPVVSPSPEPEPVSAADVPDPIVPEVALDRPTPELAPAEPITEQPVAEPPMAAEPVAAQLMAEQPMAAEPVTAAMPASDAGQDAGTRLLMQALAQLMVEKGLLTRDELHARVRALQLANESSD